MRCGPKCRPQPKLSALPSLPESTCPLRLAPAPGADMIHSSIWCGIESRCLSNSHASALAMCMRHWFPVYMLFIAWKNSFPIFPYENSSPVRSPRQWSCAGPALFIRYEMSLTNFSCTVGLIKESSTKSPKILYASPIEQSSRTLS